MVTHVIQFYTEDFLERTEVVNKIGITSLADVNRQCIATVTLMCLAYFSLFSSITDKYMKFSIEHIMPGVSLCEKMGKTTTEKLYSVEERLHELQTYSH